MCYIKSIQKIQQSVLYTKKDLISVGDDSLNQQMVQTQSYYYFPQFFVIPQFNNLIREFQIRTQINKAFEEIERNAHQISQLNQKLKQSQENLTKISENLQTFINTPKFDIMEEKKTASHISDQEPQQLAVQNFESDKKLTNIIFGKRSYQYKLALTEEFPSIIYRERNIKLGVKLISQTGQILKNDNLINLYLSFCDKNGKWIINNRVGDPMLKGKSSTELCSGETQFNKIYPQDISRTFPDGQVNIVVYAKSLAVVYDGTNSKTSQKVFINPDLIQPLIIEGVTIKAKKRSE